MQDDNGLIWHDVAGGVDGDNSDNHWTDNICGTADDRHINTAFNPVVQWEFIYVQAMISDLFRTVDPEYARRTLSAAEKTYGYMRDRENSTTNAVAWAVLACGEMLKTTGSKEYELRLEQELKSSSACRNKNTALIRSKWGFWYEDTSKTDFFRGQRDTGFP